MTDGPVGCGFSVFGPEQIIIPLLTDGLSAWVQRLDDCLRQGSTAIWLEEPQPPYFVSNFENLWWLEFTFSKVSLGIRENISACHLVFHGVSFYSFFNYWHILLWKIANFLVLIMMTSHISSFTYSYHTGRTSRHSHSVVKVHVAKWTQNATTHLI